MLKDRVRSVIPGRLLRAARPVYHGAAARLAAARFGFPSRRLVVVGVTGTAGKSTTVALLSHILNNSGKKFKAGFSSTVEFFDGDERHVNVRGVSMPSGAVLQRSLKSMVEHSCTHAIIECTSEGLAQNRHLGVDFDVAIIGNLTAAHLDAHGSATAYRRAKAKLFEAVSRSARKQFFLKKMIGVNFDDYHVAYFLKFKADRKFGIAYADAERAHSAQHDGREVDDLFIPQRLEMNERGSTFTLRDVQFELPLPGLFNVYNAAMAIATAAEFGVDLHVAAAALKSFAGIEGRMQEIPNVRGIRVYVDYAPEPVPMQAALETLAAGVPSGGRLIHVFGATGGHRDVAKRAEFGEISASLADVIVVTNDDVYDSDPQKIINDIREGISHSVRKPEVHVVSDRREAIARAIAIARPRDAVLITGKGNEKFLVLPGNERISWNEPQLVAELLSK
jgi:UDP-N-acetylmuramoyl-L-alanyl-D-glutamate--2,6-diaminopimelate ligase